MILCCDNNSSAINISKNSVQHSRTKHINNCHHFTGEMVESKKIMLEHVRIGDQIADVFIKALNVVQFKALRVALGLCTINL